MYVLIHLWVYTQGINFTLENSLFGTVKLTASRDPNKNKYFGDSIAFDKHKSFSLSDGHAFVQKVIILGADMSLSLPDDNKK